MQKVPRDYQTRTVELCREAVGRGVRRMIICAPTGAGKTLTACMFMQAAVEKGRSALFLAPQRELILQASAHLNDCSVRHSVLLASHPEMFDPAAPVTVASKDTLASRALRRTVMELPRADLVVVDECHLSMAREWRTLLSDLDRKYNPVFIGLSATPSRATGHGLGEFWQEIVSSARYDELIQSGYLVPVRAFAPVDLDMGDFRGTDSQWDKEAGNRMSKRSLVGNVWDHWELLARDRQTVIFASTVRHSMHLREEGVRRGVRVAHLDAGTPEDERQQVLDDLAAWELDAVCNCDILSVGWDQPSVSCVILAAPSRSLVKFRQRAGRALRPAPMKDDCLLIDHSGAILAHGFPDEDIEWVLDKNSNITVSHQRERERKQVDDTCCPNCFCVYRGRRDCPQCGSQNGPSAREIAFKRGLLREVKRTQAKKRQVDRSPPAMRKYWMYCLATAANRGRTYASALAMFGSRYGHSPHEENLQPEVPPWDYRQYVHVLFPGFRRP